MVDRCLLLGAVLSILLLPLCPCSAEPNRMELAAFRAIVPDFSKTSGGCHPALSRDAKTLAFRSEDGRSIYILRDDTLADLDGSNWASFTRERPSPWKLQFQPVDDTTGPTTYYANTLVRSMDWSPDGKKLVFCYGQRIYVAEDIDYSAQKASVRMVAEARKDSGGKLIGQMESPRWSPDSRFLVYVRVSQSHDVFLSPNTPSELCVLDPVSGKETVLAKDAADGPWVYVQPWSPDGKHITYAARVPRREGPTSTEVESDGETFEVVLDEYAVCVVSTDGKERRRIAEPYSASPSWSPNSESIAFVALREWEVKASDGESTVGGTRMTLCVVDSRGAKLRTLEAGRLPSPEDLVKWRKQRIAERCAFVVERMGSALNDEQRKHLLSGKLSGDEAYAWSCIYAAWRIGGEFEKVVRANAVKFGVASDKEQDAADLAIDEAVKKLDIEKQRQYRVDSEFLGNWWNRSRWGSLSSAASDDQPVWSPDGQRIAIIGWCFGVLTEDVVIVDLLSNRARTLMTSGDIDCVSWLPDSSGLVLQAVRDIAATTILEPARKGSYSEIWLLKPW